jgi:hypothetical protein
MLHAREATPEDLRSLAGRLREADLKEIYAAGHADPLVALQGGMGDDSLVLVGVDEEDVPHLVFGVGDTPIEGLGAVWMMASDTIKDHWVQVLRETRPWVQRIGVGYKLLSNYVHADNTLHIRWLKWAGFTFLRKVQFNNHDFYEFAKIVPKEVQHV